MDRLRFKGEWNEVKGRLKQKYAQLTDNDLKYDEGREDELLGKMQKALGKGKDEVREIINNI